MQTRMQGCREQMVADYSEHKLAVGDEIQKHKLRINTTNQCVYHTYGQQQTQLHWLVNHSTAAQRDMGEVRHLVSNTSFASTRKG
jgi:hypothetical protein